jgi:DNA polymerase
MGADEIHPAELESLLSFWAEAGVDYALEDAAQNRLAPRPARRRPNSGPSPPPQTVPVEAPLSAAALVAGRARDLAASAASVEALDAGRAEVLEAWTRLGQRPQFASAPWRAGPLNAPLAVITDAGCDNLESGDQILRDEEARLFSAMAQGAGLSEKIMLCALAPALSGDRAPELDALSPLHPFVVRLLELAQPRFVLILGAGAAQALGSALALSELSRSVADIDLAGSPASALITLHPRFLLRQPLGKKRAWADLLAVKARLAL